MDTNTNTKDLDLTNIDDLVKFFRRMLLEKAKSEKEDGLDRNKPQCTTPPPGGTLGLVEGAPKYIVSIFRELCC